MYKNFNLTESEKEQILNMHKDKGYGKKLREGDDETYFARHGEDGIGWTGSSNKIYKNLPDGDYDDETYDDFDSLHTTYPEFHSHYSGKGNVDGAKSMFDTYKRSQGPLVIKKRRIQNEEFQEEEPVLKSKPLYGRVEFNNGGKVSIQASRSHYCQPRNDEGPYTHVEIGFPTRETRIPKLLIRFEESSQHGQGEGFNPYESVYGYVPASVVNKLIQMNGGVKSGEVPPLVSKGEVGEMDEDFDGMASNIEPHSKFESTERLMNSITDRLITAVQLQEWSLVEEVVSDIISFKKKEQ
jgi:hypothetical protein